MARTQVNRDPEVFDWTFRRGDTWTFSWTLGTSASPSGADLSGSTWLFQIRDGGEDGSVFTTVAVDTSGQSSGYIVGKVDESVTEAATVGRGVYYYDVQQTLDGDVVTPVAGRITVTADVSKD